MTPADIIALGQSLYTEPQLEKTRPAPAAADYFPPIPSLPPFMVGCQPLESILARKTVATGVATKPTKASVHLT